MLTRIFKGNSVTHRACKIKSRDPYTALSLKAWKEVSFKSTWRFTCTKRCVSSKPLRLCLRSPWFPSLPQPCASSEKPSRPPAALCALNDCEYARKSETFPWTVELQASTYRMTRKLTTFNNYRVKRTPSWRNSCCGSLRPISFLFFFFKCMVLQGHPSWMLRC